MRRGFSGREFSGSHRQGRRFGWAPGYWGGGESLKQMGLGFPCPPSVPTPLLTPALQPPLPWAPPLLYVPGNSVSGKEGTAAIYMGLSVSGPGQLLRVFLF